MKKCYSAVLCLLIVVSTTADEIVDESTDPKALWSFSPVVDPQVPSVRLKEWPRDDIDRFILARMEAEDLSPGKDADPRDLIRRLYVDLTGLPPSYEQVRFFVQSFEKDRNAAVATLVDELLGSQHFGERWGRHWLDVARYGESNGNDGLGRNPTFPHAWRYRDYVIDAFNRDTPYDQFITEQIAGDLLPHDSVEQRNRQLTATGFLALGSKPAKAMNNNFDMDVVDNQIDVVSTGVMGLSVACARCHDHKHDPIPTSDYYALAGIFKSSETMWGKAANEKLTAPVTPLHELKDPSEKEIIVQEIPNFADGYESAIAELKPAIHYSFADRPNNGEKIEAKVSFSKQRLAEFSGGRVGFDHEVSKEEEMFSYSVSFWFRNELTNNARPITAYILSRGKDGQKQLPGGHLGLGGNHKKEFTGKLFFFNGPDTGELVIGSTTIPPKTWNHVVLIRDGKKLKVFLNGVTKPEIDAEVTVIAEEVNSFFLGGRSDKFAPLSGRVGQFAYFNRVLTAKEAKALHEASGQPVGTRAPKAGMLAMGVRDRAKIEDCKVNLGGDSKKLGKSVPRGFLTACGDAGEDVAVPSKQSGRLELANWLVSGEHPQTARVMVNRIWLHLFGNGLVATPDDFGVYGARPTHPELLDHLATRFVQNGWSVKSLIRDIVLTRTYQLSCESTQQSSSKDPDNLRYTRHNRRRLDAESIRDAIMTASGTLDLNPGNGSAVQDQDILINGGKFEHQPSNHRSVYLCMLRSAPPPELAAFDLPDGLDAAGQRNETTLPSHALFLLNSPFVTAQAELFARSVVGEIKSQGQEGVVRLVYSRALARDVTPAELANSIKLLKAIDSDLRSKITDEKERRIKAIAALCQAVLASNEFRYID